jgi:hypothetical protein
VRADDDDLLRPRRAADFAREVAALAVGHFVFLPLHTAAGSFQFGLDVIGRLCQLPRPIADVPFADLDGQLLDIAVQFGRELRQGFVGGRQLAAKARSRHIDHYPPQGS